MSRFYLVDAAPAWIFDYFDLDHFKRAIPTTDHFTPGDPDVYEVPSKFSTATTNKEFPGFDQLPADQHWYFGDSTKGAVRLFGQYVSVHCTRPKTSAATLPQFWHPDYDAYPPPPLPL